jgi:CubicO group peptidase (beta-lactamase class C family)
VTDKFEIGSNGKAMTATLLALLIEEGALRWNSTLFEIFGHTLRGMNPAWRNVTLRQLVDHRSGLASDPFGILITRTLLSTASPRRERLAIVEQVLARPPGNPPDTKFAYTSAAYVIVGAAIENATGRSWEDLIRDRLFAPLGMGTAGMGAPAAPRQLDQPWGHTYRFLFPIFGFGRSDTPIAPANLVASMRRAAAPAGVMHMSGADWAKFIALVLRSHPANPERHVALLNAESFAKLYEPDPRNEVNSADGYYAAGWFVTTRPWAKGNRPVDVGRLLWNAGDTGGWNSTAYLAPEIDFAVIVACNRGGQWDAGSEVAEALVVEFARRARVPGTGLNGHWEGLIGRLRITLELPGGEVATRAPMLISLDQGNARTPITVMTERGGNVHFETGNGGVFDGSFNREESVLAGTWKQPGLTRWVVFARSNPATVAREARPPE